MIHLLNIVFFAFFAFFSTPLLAVAPPKASSSVTPKPGAAQSKNNLTSLLNILNTSDGESLAPHIVRELNSFTSAVESCTNANGPKNESNCDELLNLLRHKCLTLTKLSSQLALSESLAVEQICKLATPRSQQSTQECPCFSRQELEFCSITNGQLSNASEFLNAFCPNPLDNRLETIELTSPPEHPDTLVCTHRDKDAKVLTLFTWKSSAAAEGENKIAQEWVNQCERLICSVHNLNLSICRRK